MNHLNFLTMKHFILKTVVLVVASVMSTTAFSKSWRVNDDVTKKGNFLDINSAMVSNEVEDGDTLYLDPGCKLGLSQEVTKAVTIIGTGYFLENMPYEEAFVSGNLSLSAQNCKVYGLHCADVIINESDVILERCQLSSVTGNGKSDVKIRSCYIKSAKSILVSDGTNWVLENSIIICENGNSSTSYVINGLSNCLIRNNYLYGHNPNYYVYCLSELTGCLIFLMIRRPPRSTHFRNVYSCSITKNVFSGSAISEYPNNLYGESVNSVFVFSGNNDRRFQLSSNSPAKGYATDDGDCGPYGNGYTYVPSGMPYGHPYFTEVQVGSVTKENKLKATYKVSIQDE